MKTSNFYLKIIITINIIFFCDKSFGMSVDVDCENINQSLQEVLNLVEEGSHIMFHGSCYGSIRIEKDRLSIIGKPGSRLIVPSDSSFGVAVSGRQVDIKNMNISGGERGIAIYRGGSAEISNSTITDAKSISIEITESSYARIE